ncbi:MAG: cysteine hydrolase, partial [Peptococcaceae bacterium]|nr:cysteine hydrolase [Peptococcaceae bacterium]
MDTRDLLVVVDMQNDFITGALGTKEAQAIVPNVKAKIDEFVQNGQQIIFTRDTHYEDYMDTQEGFNLPVMHCIEGTEGWEIERSLQLEDAMVFDKITFGSPELAAY